MLLDISFAPRQDGGFKADLKKRVDAYFKEKGISKHWNAHMLLKTIFYLTIWASLYLLIMSGEFSEPVMLAMALMMGFFLTCIGFNIGHDALHGAYSSNPRVNWLASLSFELIGAHSYTWKIRHNLIHHTYTNIIGSDGDLESMPLLRFCVKPGRKWYHRYQHWYASILYCFVTLVWVFKKDYLHIFEERREQRLNQKPSLSVYLWLFGGKAFHYALFIILPILVLNLPVWKVIIGFFAMHFVAGYVMATVFQLGHLVEGPDFVPAPAEGVVGDSWIEHQLKTTANFSSNFLVSWICGGLNYQIEHHLFPSICHVHYPAISPIVRQAAQEYGLPYNDLGGFFTAVRSHHRLMKYFGTTDPPLVAVA